jgi:threonine dehydratase
MSEPLASSSADTSLTLDAIRANAGRLKDRVRRTPLWPWNATGPEYPSPGTAELLLKLELFQHTGSFKARGALSVMLGLDSAQLARGVTAVSAGNHAVAVAWCARELGTTAKVVMMKTANPRRVELCRRYGAEVVLAEDIATAFDRMNDIARTEGRAVVHPFDDPRTVLGTATIGVELLEQAAAEGRTVDAVVIPVGGGGLAAGVAAAVKLTQPGIKVYGVEPEGADSMSRSFREGSPQRIEAVRTIADSLGAPYALPYTYGLCRAYIDRMVTVTDDQIRAAMALLFRDMKLAVEPAGAAATAGVLGPLGDELVGRSVAVIVCGANIDFPTFAMHLGATST